ncbi:MAG: cell division protein ZapE [Mesorhizobium amorphae]|nr:MAG: cell division protein ZapE [Mesorhizobium amorphae]
MSVDAPLAARLRAEVARGALKPDPAQAQAVEALDALREKIVAHAGNAAKKGALGWLFARGRARAEAPRGLYLHGGVGRGKTMLMDWFFTDLPIGPKRRVHFNDFMADVHDRIAKQRALRKAGEDDPIPPVAKAIANGAWVLCFDEFTVTDIADAMILSRLFSALWREGVVLVATSNVAPQNLYRDGLNRGLFLPFVRELESRCRVLPLDGGTDYRMLRLGDVPSYLSPLGAETDRAMDEAWALVTAGRKAEPAAIPILGREIAVPQATTDAARFAFADLCGKPLGARDYLAVAARYPTLFLDHVPVLAQAQRNEAKRFILLIDTLYDRRARLFISAAAPPDALYAGKSGTEAFEWARTASRLHEMQSRDWMEQWQAWRTPVKTRV